MDIDDILWWCKMAIATIIIFSALIFGVRGVEMAVNNVPVKVWVEDKLVFEGPSYCVEVSSGGYTTSVKISGGFLSWIPQKYYTSKSVKVEGVK
jgi:hypothetical protein